MRHSKDTIFTFIKDYSKTRGFIETICSIGRTLSLSHLYEDYLVIKGISNGKRSFGGPKFVQIDLTDNCNNNCVCCWCNSALITEKPNRRDFLDYSILIKTIDDLSRIGVKEITLSGGGEPFMHPQLFDVIAAVKDKGMYCQLYTNFTLAREESIRRLVGLGLDRLTVSLWAADPKVYSLMHPGKGEDCFDEIKNNLAFFSGIKNKNQLLCIHNVISSINYNQLIKIADFACAVGADEVSFTPVDAIPRKTDSLLLNDEQRRQVMLDCSRLTHDIKFTGLDEFKRRISADGSCQGIYDREIIDTVPCYLGWIFARIKADGNVNPCLKSHQINVGNIYKQHFYEIWNSPLQQEFRCKARAHSKADSYFHKVGNGGNSGSGCARFCDDVTRNIVLYRKLNIIPTSKLLFRLVELEGAILKTKRRTISLFRIIYLACVIIIYTLMLRAYRLIKKISIFPGE